MTIGTARIADWGNQAMSIPWKCPKCTEVENAADPLTQKVADRNMCGYCQRKYYRDYKRRVGIVEDGPTGTTWDNELCRKWMVRKW